MNDSARDSSQRPHPSHSRPQAAPPRSSQRPLAGAPSPEAPPWHASELQDEPHSSTFGHSRRTHGVQTKGRAAAVVERVLRASAEEFGRVGYEALRIEDVALRSGVHKTTIYRRWPTKLELMEATFKQTMMQSVDHDLGNVIDDLTDMLEQLANFTAEEPGRGIMRAIQMNKFHPDLAPMLRDLRARNQAIRMAAIDRAVARGELPPDTDVALLSDLIGGAVMARILGCTQHPPKEWIRRAVRIVIAGVQAVG